MQSSRNSENGSAMVLAIGVMAVLALIAIVVISVVIAEKRSSSSQYAQDRAFYSADAAGEAGVHWIKTQLSPPALVDTMNSVRAAAGYTALSDDHLYDYSVGYVGKQFRPGWSVEYKDYIYRVDAQGKSAQQSKAAVDFNGTRLYREGY
jgi:Tfp pilus assembly protein PilX